MVPLRPGRADIDGPDLTVMAKKNETEWHSGGSIAELSRIGAQDA